MCILVNCCAPILLHSVCLTYIRAPELAHWSQWSLACCQNMQNRNACGTCGINFFGLFWLLIRTFFGLQVHLTKRISMLVLQFSRLATISITKLHSCIRLACDWLRWELREYCSSLLFGGWSERIVHRSRNCWKSSQLLWMTFANVYSPQAMAHVFRLPVYIS